MKTLKFIIPVFLFTILFVGCSSDDDNSSAPSTNPLEGLHKVHEMSGAGYTVEIYSEKSRLEVGYNDLSLRIKEVASNTYIKQVSPTWELLMDMGDMAHGAPYSNLKSVNDGSVYNGHIVFTMAGDHHHGWELAVNFDHSGNAISIGDHIAVEEPTNGLVNTQVFTGSDGVDYVLAYVAPRRPEVAINDMEALLYEMREDMVTFPVVGYYSITIDPRMPSMGNHSSPNNVDLTYDSSSQSYKGKLSLSMTGYWKINMKLINSLGEVVKGEDVTEDHPESSLYFEIEF